MEIPTEEAPTLDTDHPLTPKQRKQAILNQFIDLAEDLFFLALNHQTGKRCQTGGQQAQQCAHERNGEAFGDPHEAYGHGTALYEENVHVPMLLWSPRLFPNGGRSPVIGSHVSRTVQVIEQWEPLEAVVRGLAGSSGDSLVMVNDTQRQIALWGVGAEDGRLGRMDGIAVQHLVQAVADDGDVH